jgi:hypothetical protein
MNKELGGLSSFIWEFSGMKSGCPDNIVVQTCQTILQANEITADNVEFNNTCANAGVPLHSSRDEDPPRNEDSPRNEDPPKDTTIAQLPGVFVGPNAGVDDDVFDPSVSAGDVGEAQTGFLPDQNVWGSQPLPPPPRRREDPLEEEEEEEKKPPSNVLLWVLIALAYVAAVAYARRKS